MILETSVGRGGANAKPDVRFVQRMLNNAGMPPGTPLLVVDGIAGPKTNSAIESYQRRQGLTADGRIDPAGPTLKHLTQAFLDKLVSVVVYRPLPGSIPEPLSASAAVSALVECLRSLRN
jgi:peptidoglycan hydrolase-like protein with peptidoglycan-binding domain